MSDELNLDNKPEEGISGNSEAAGAEKTVEDATTESVVVENAAAESVAPEAAITEELANAHTASEGTVSDSAAPNFQMVEPSPEKKAEEEALKAEQAARAERMRRAQQARREEEMRRQRAEQAARQQAMGQQAASQPTGNPQSMNQPTGNSQAAYQQAARQQQSAQRQPHYDYYQTNQQSKAAQAKAVKKDPKSNGMGKKFGIAVALAVVFGLVAGLVFQGVNLVGNRLFGTSRTETVQNQVETTKPVVGAQTGDEEVDIDAATSYSGGSVADVASACLPSVVAITTISIQEIPDYFGYGTQQYEGEASGSGIIVGENDNELLIATNNHVVEGATNLSVFFYGSEIPAASQSASETQDLDIFGGGSSSTDSTQIAEDAVTGQIKGTDADNDLAVVAVNKADIPSETMETIKVCQLGDSESLQVGEQVVAIGNALGYGQSVTSGYVSALNRQVEIEGMASSLIQTDAAINPGNSGGALLNMRGELIGINSAKFSDETVEGMGYAIPISVASPILDELMTKETRSIVSGDDAAYIGITCKNITSETSQMYGMPVGVFVASVEENGAADKAGLQKSDVITALDGESVSTYDDLTGKLKYYAAGETVDMTIQRQSGSGEYEEKTISITFGSKADANPDSGTESENGQPEESAEPQP